MIPEIQALCRKHRLQYLYVTGSLLRPADFRPDSDIDWVFAFDRAAIADEDFLTNFDDFWDGLERTTNRKADLVHYPSLKNPYFISSVDETKRLVYASEKVLV
ncbi:MAG: hypothetical protein OHK0039_25480 [Bacteroidia bacterium]